MDFNHPIPYFAVIFTSVRTNIEEDYTKTAQQMEKLAKGIDGYLGMEHAKNDVGITVSYWKDLDAISQWKSQIDHQKAQQMGKEKWYQSYTVRIAKVEREYHFQAKT